ncbi:MAG: MlaD family protein [Draconibacterium sp.]
MRLSKYARLGILIVFALTILFWGLSYLKGNDFFSRTNYYYVHYDRVDGLAPSSKVMMNGFPVGKVRKIEFTSDHTGRLLVTLAIDSEFKIPKNSVAQIISSDIMGTRSIKLDMSDELTYHHANDTIRGSIEHDLKEQVSMQVLPLKNKAEELLGTLDSALTVFTAILNEDARANLSSSFANINQSIKNIEATTSDLQEIVSAEKVSMRSIISNIDTITTTFKNNASEFDATIKNLHSFSDTLSQIKVSPVLDNIQHISEQLLATLEKLNSDDNTAGLLLNDDELYYSINMLSENMAFLISDVQKNPKRYLQLSAFDFGKDVYVNTKQDLSARDIVFKVHLVSSKIKLDMNTERFEGVKNIEEFYSGGVYSYLVGNTGVYSEIELLFSSVKKKFPDSSIVAFKNGRIISLEKALRKIQ